MKSIRILAVLLSIGLLAVGCSQEPEMTAPDTQTYYHYDKNGTESLGVPSITIASGSCYAQGGVGMVGVESGTINIDVPVGATVNQVLLYWAGGTTGAPGDDTIKIDGNDVTGVLIGGPTNFFSNYHFSAYRADITPMGLVTDGLGQSFVITEFDFDFSGGSLDENNGIGMMVIYDDGTLAEISVRDGLDMAYFDFLPTLDGTDPQTFTFAAEPADRMGRLVIFAGSVGEGRRNAIKITTSAGDDIRDDLLGSEDGLLWDTLCLQDILIPAGDTSLTVELISTVTPVDPIEGSGASMAWVGAGLSVPVSPPPELACLGDTVWVDVNVNGIQDEGELGREGVVVYLMDCQGNELDDTMTDADGKYLFCELEPGDYNVKFMLPMGYMFTIQDQGDDTKDSDADPSTGMTHCTTLGPGDNDMTLDAGIHEIPVERVGCRMTGGGNDEFFPAEGGVNQYTFGGQAGAPIASQPQPWGNWTHTQKKGVAGSFTFHGGTPSAPEDTEIDWIECMDPGWCVQARKAPAKQLDFGGVGTFKNMKNVPSEIADHVIVGESLHWFEVNIDDLGEPGGHNLPDGCDPLGYGRNGGTELADCDCPDFYRIRIYEGMDDMSNVMYEVYGYIDGGNFQIHPPTGRDSMQYR